MGVYCIIFCIKLEDQGYVYGGGFVVPAVPYPLYYCRLVLATRPSHILFFTASLVWPLGRE